MLQRLGMVVVVKQKMIGLREKADFLIAVAKLREESLNLSGRDEDIVRGIDDKHGHGDFRRGVQTTTDEVKETLEKADGVGVDFVRCGFKPTPMGFIARDPFRRIVLVAVGKFGDGDAMRGSRPKKEAKDRLLPPTWFHGHNDDGRGKD